MTAATDRPSGRTGPALFRAGLFAALLIPGASRAGSVGIGAGVAFDLPDPSPPVVSRFGPSPNLLVPIRLDVAPSAAVRTTLHLAFAQGTDFVSWVLPGRPREGEETRAWLGSAAVTIGPEIRLPVSGPVEPYFAGGVGIGLVHTWHNIERADLFDLEHYPAERLANGLTIDPFTRQVVFATDLAVGVAIERWWLELGYGLQFVGHSPLVHATPLLDARREGFGWNTVRLVAGFSIPVAGDR